MPQNPSLGSFSDEKQVCIGFYLDSYSQVQTDPQGVRLYRAFAGLDQFQATVGPSTKQWRGMLKKYKGWKELCG